MPTLCLVSEIPTLGGPDLQSLANALQTQFTFDVAQAWGIYAGVDWSLSLDLVSPGSQPIVVEAQIDAPGAAGYHDSEANGTPEALIAFASGWQQTVSHEAIEMAVDPSGDRTHPAIIDGEHVDVLEEPADPCEDIGYLVSGIMLSNFVYPSYYDMQGQAPYDHLGQITAPLTLLQGGYLSYKRADGTWLQATWFDGDRPTVTVLGRLLKTGSWRSVIDRVTRLRKAGRCFAHLVAKGETLRDRVEQLKA